MTTDILAILEATVRITAVKSANGAASVGTGYLLAHNRIGTAAHVVAGTMRGQTLVAFRGGMSIQADVEASDTVSDSAVLRLATPAPASAQPLPLAAQVEWKAPFDGYGFPSAAKKAGVTFEGIVSNPFAEDDLGADVYELTSGEASAGMATPLHGFSGSPVVVNGTLIGHLKRFIADPSDPLRPAFGKVYATRINSVAALLAGLPGPVSDAVTVDPPKPGSTAQREQSGKVLALVDRWRAEGRLDDKSLLDAAESLIQLASPADAVGLLAASQPAVRKDQLQALALAKIGGPDNLNQSLQILERLRDAGHLDAESGGLLAGRYKQRWVERGQRADLVKAQHVYRQTFDLTAHHYPGINAAALSLWLGDQAASRAIAAKVRDGLSLTPRSAMDCWTMASLAEAHLLADDTDQASRWYRRAAEQCQFAPGTVAIMRGQLTRNLEHLGLAADSLGDPFEPGEP